MDIGSVHLGWVDVAWLTLLAVSIVVGLLRGLVSQVLSLMGWGVAYVGSQWLGADVAPFVPVGAPGSSLNAVIGVVVAFVVLFLAWSTLSWLIGQLVRGSPLSAADRALGGVFGAARALVIALMIVTLVGMTPLARSAAWQASQGVSVLQTLEAGLRPILPPEISKFLMR